MKRWQWQLQQLRVSLGWTGLGGLCLLLAAAAIYMGLVLPGQHEIGSLKTELANLRSHPQPGRNYAPEEELALFYDFFPPREALAEQLRTLHQIAADEGLAPERVDYKLSRIAGTPLWRYQTSFPLSADYSSLRYYLAAVLEALPNASLEDVELQRQDTKTDQLEAKVSLTLYYREVP